MTCASKLLLYMQVIMPGWKPNICVAAQNVTCESHASIMQPSCKSYASHANDFARTTMMMAMATAMTAKGNRHHRRPILDHRHSLHASPWNCKPHRAWLKAVNLRGNTTPSLMLVSCKHHATAMQVLSFTMHCRPAMQYAPSWQKQ